MAGMTERQAERIIERLDRIIALLSVPEKTVSAYADEGIEEESVVSADDSESSSNGLEARREEIELYAQKHGVEWYEAWQHFEDSGYDMSPVPKWQTREPCLAANINIAMNNPCMLDKGHPGDHNSAYMEHVYEWNSSNLRG